MASTKITIKPHEQKYQWSQTEESITISFLLKNVPLKNIDVLYTPEFIKINAPSVKYITYVDFPGAGVDSDNPRNRIQLLDNSLDVFLIKAEHGNHWDKLQVDDMTREELIKRRDVSL